VVQQIVLLDIRINHVDPRLAIASEFGELLKDLLYARKGGIASDAAGKFNVALQEMRKILPLQATIFDTFIVEAVGGEVRRFALLHFWVVESTNK